MVKQVLQFVRKDLIRYEWYESPEEAGEVAVSTRATEEKRKEGERNRRSWVVDSSSGTLGWWLPCFVRVCICVLQMSNGLWRARLSCLVLHPFHHYMPSISSSLSLSVSSLCSSSPFPPSLLFASFIPDRLILHHLLSPRGVWLLTATSSSSSLSSLCTDALLCFSPEPQFNFAARAPLTLSCAHTQSSGHLTHLPTHTHAPLKLRLRHGRASTLSKGAVKSNGV